ncbi:site-specific recombinase XerD [Maribacter caenipelagi]|uniref:Site-specific recombinase XerD n=1 Tax=Maribacter caenipelagi TaxID=1447781 RepID=A0A4R7DEV5_9FLAO|nr:site-specific integrase [Maribacter caenipelagi]TDS18875.1 site-specific recombinase XerD [Maribacter caenipelagi]
MSIIKYSLLYVLQKSRLNKRGKCPIRGRITLDSKRKEFSTGQFIYPENWNTRKQLAIGDNVDVEFINKQLSLIKQKLDKAFLMLELSEVNFTIDDLFRAYKGDDNKKDLGVLEYFNSYLERRKELIGIDIVQSTWNKFSYLKSDLKSFVGGKYGGRDFMLSRVDIKFINDFEHYLKTKKNKKQVTVNKNLQRFKSVVKSAVSENVLDKYPYSFHRLKKVKTEVLYLSRDELQKLEKYKFAQTRLEQVRDMFVFCCYTGLGYQEMATLKKENLVEAFDGYIWIRITRKKTSTVISVPLLPKAEEILQKYEYELPVISNQRFNSYLKEIAAIVGLQIKLTHHIARKTFATTILLYNDVPMEVVSELLGHSKLSITQEHYAKVVQRKISEEMIMLKTKLKN